MAYNRVLTVQDVSCFGQCSLTVALPILSVCGAETCILPSAVLSTHTSGFQGYTFADLTDEIPKIQAHWKKEGIAFDCIYTGYLGSEKQIEYVKSIVKDLSKPQAVSIIDPAMADNGKLYPAFDGAFVEKMKSLTSSADIVLPNITEACLLTDTPFQTSYGEEYIDTLLRKLCQGGAKTIVLTGVGYSEDKTGVVVYERGKKQYYEHRKIARNCHGTGDVYASAFVGAYLKGKSVFESAKIAADFTVACIEKTVSDETHWYGVKFELALPLLIRLLA